MSGTEATKPFCFVRFKEKSVENKVSIFRPCWSEPRTLGLSSLRAQRAGPKGLRAESAMAVTGRRCPHSGEGEDFLMGQLNLFTKTAVTPERKVEKSIPRWEINRHAEG